MDRGGCRAALEHAATVDNGKVPPGNPRQARTNYRCSDQGLAGFACRTSTAPDSQKRQAQEDGIRNEFLGADANPINLVMTAHIGQVD